MSNTPTPTGGLPDVIALAEVNEGQIALVGGKAAGLAAMIASGERVPDGFCITTAAYEKAVAGRGEIETDLHRQIELHYRRIGGGPVAVRSSATAEDLPHLSFAGQYETVLNVNGVEEIVAAVRRCWDSLSNPRVAAYREAAGANAAPARMAVVVQRMVDPVAAGVLFTANPITGCRTEMVIDAVAGLGDAVVSGSVIADHYGVNEAGDVVEQHPDGGCLTSAQLGELRAAGARLQRRAGTPQDVEWAFDRDGALWLLQARPITTLFPPPPSRHPGPRVFLEVGHVQGMLRPFTPMGMSTMWVVMAHVMKSVGVAADPFGEDTVLSTAAGRMFLDITSVVRYQRLRSRLPEAMRIYGPRVSRAIERVLDDPRFAPLPGRPFRLRTVLPVVARIVPRLVAGMVGALAWPAVARRRAWRATQEIRRRCRPPDGLSSAADRIRFAVAVQRLFPEFMDRMVSPLYAAMIARGIAGALLAGVATASELDETERGMPHNVTTEMDLELWRLAAAAGRQHRDLLLQNSPSELASAYLSGRLPEIGLGEFLRRYGHRGAAEIDVGVPRWAEDPTPVFSAIASYLQLTDPDQAPDQRFARAAKEATAKIDQLVRRARRTRPLRAGCAGFLLRRSRALSGLRELPKFAWLYPLAETRRQLLAAGAELCERRLLDRPDDIMFLTIREALAAAEGEDVRALIAERRTAHERELRRRVVPVVLLSDGTNPETLVRPTSTDDTVLTGMPAAPGTATGRARVVLDPTQALVEPGEILVAPTTDPGWTPLFLTAAGLVTETGSPVAHGPMVAREYGIPAVICIPDATRTITTGQLITIDGSAGTVALTASDPG